MTKAPASRGSACAGRVSETRDEPVVADTLDLGLALVRNASELPFITSDNPVAWFDPEGAEDEARPYALRPEGKVAMLFPVAPDMRIYGHSDFREEFGRRGLLSAAPADSDFVQEMNRRLCRFAYGAVFTSKDMFRDLVEEHRDICPVVRTSVATGPDGEYILSSNEWGKRSAKPKWKARD